MTKPVTWSPNATAALERVKGRLFATTTEASAILDVDPRTLRRQIEEGNVPAFRAGTTYRIPTGWLLEQARIPVS